MLEAALSYAKMNGDRFLGELREFLTIPSVSTDPEHDADMHKAADWVSSQLASIGMQNVQILPTEGHPVVYAEWLRAGHAAPTVMIYGHYDVQPPDPLELWSSPPFQPTVRGDNLYGRGSADMKGQVVACLKAVESMVRNGGLPVNIKWLIEGEEEIGSEHLDTFIQKNKALLGCDFCLNADAEILGEDEPSITTGLRGLAYFELRIHGPSKDLHSGLFGGIVHNPAQALAELIAGMHDAHGKVTLPGFYGKVRKLTKKERQNFAGLPLSNKLYRAQTGVPYLWGEPGFTPPERLGARPTLEVNGLLSGFTGTGSKTVLPAWAMAKISCRLVPDQTVKDTVAQMRAYMKQKAPKDIRWELIYLHGAGAALVSDDSPGVRAMSKAMKTVWGKQPHLLREGGSIGVVEQLQKRLGVDSLLSGFGLPDCDAHSPNEKQHLPTWYRGIETLIRFFYNLSRSMEDRIIAYGGQAVIEGVMMRGKSAFAIAMRAPDGTIVLHQEKLGQIYRSRIAQIPFLRGVILLWDALGLGMRALTIAANTQSGDNEKLEGPALYITLGLALIFGVALFFLLPAGLGALSERFLAWNAWWSNVLEGAIRLLLLTGYIWAIGFLPDVGRLFAYHGAEHKTINAYEAGADLNPPSVAQYPLQHPRCGTAFLLTLVLLSVFVFAALGPLPILWRLTSRIVLIPVLAGIAVEYIRWTANHLDSRFVRWLIRPNLALQGLTTREPDLSMLEVAIASFKSMRQGEIDFAV